MFGVATERCWFGFDASGNQVILFHLLTLDNMDAETAIKRIDILTQVQYWQEHLSKIVNRDSRPSIA
ncbi:MAG: type III secretion system chaperone [Symbiopectobacterium sp.]